MIAEEEKIAGDNWIGRRVVSYLSESSTTTKRRERGTITAVRRSADGKDIEYEISYDNGLKAWESVHDGWRFVSHKYEPQRVRVIELRKERGTYSSQLDNIWPEDNTESSLSESTVCILFSHDELYSLIGFCLNLPFIFKAVSHPTTNNTKLDLQTNAK
jgi:hypothetical protein